MRFRARVSSKGQVTIPLEVRKRLGLDQGHEVDFIFEDGKTLISPARGTDNPFEAYVGALNTFETAAEAVDWVRDLRDQD